MSLSILSSISNHKYNNKVKEYELFTLNFTGGTDYTNGGNYPFNLNQSGFTTRCSITNLTNANLNTTAGITVWVRYKMNALSYQRALSFNRNQNQASWFFISYNGTNYTKYDYSMKVNNTTTINGTTGVLFNSNNVYNFFYTFITISSIVYYTMYIHDDAGNQLFTVTASSTSTNFNASPFTNFDLLYDGVFTADKYRGTIYMAAKIPRVLASNERSAYSTMTV